MASQVQATVNPHPVHHPRLATPDPDIQLAESECGKASVWAVARPGSHSVCGPRPAKLTTICMVVLSIWVMVVLIIHLEKKLSVMTSSLSYTEDKLRTMEDTANSYRVRTSGRLQSIQHMLGEILNSVKTGIHSEKGEDRKLPNSARTVEILTTPTDSRTTTTKHTTVLAITEEELEEDFFGEGWLD